MEDAWVYFVIDNNATMRGKLISVGNVIREIVASARPTIKFTVFKASPTALKLGSEKQQNFPIHNVLQQLQSQATSQTRKLFDAWGLAFNDFPSNEIRYIHVVLVANGADNSSLIYDRDSLLELISQKMLQNANLKVTLVQTGVKTDLVFVLQSKLCGFGSRFTSIVVDDSDPGWRFGMVQVRDTLIQNFLQTSPYACGTVPQQVASASYLATAPQNSLNYCEPKVHPFVPNVVNQGFVSLPSVARGNSPFRKAMTHRPAPTPQKTKIWVGNLPMVGQAEIQEFLKQWGPCRVETLNGSPTQWAVVAYDNDRGAEYAVKYGNGANFKGYTININKI